VKDKIIAALNSAGIQTEGQSDDQLLSAYDALKAKPVSDRLIAANAKIAEFEQAANAVRDAEVAELATKLAVNSSLSVDEYKAMPLDILKKLSAVKPAAPVITGNSGGKGEDEFASYDLNAAMKEAK
jgi:hypothetical protein